MSKQPERGITSSASMSGLASYAAALVSPVARGISGSLTPSARRASEAPPLSQNHAESTNNNNNGANMERRSSTASAPLAPPAGAPPERRRNRNLLSTYYGKSEKDQAFDEYNLDDAHFSAEKYMQKLLRDKHIDELLHVDNELAGEIRNLDSALQMLVYENYNKFISATDTIRKMKDHVANMGGEMERLSANMEEITQCSETINTNLGAKREKIEQLSSVNRMLKKLQFLLELPSRLNKCIELDTYAQAVRYYNIASGILKQYSHLPSFQAIQEESMEVMNKLKLTLKSKMNNPEASLRDVEENIRLLIDLKEPVDQLRAEFLERRRAHLLTILKQWKHDAEATRAKNLETLNRAFLPKFMELVKLFDAIFLKNPKELSSREEKLSNQELKKEFVEATREIFSEYWRLARVVLMTHNQTPLSPKVVASATTATKFPESSSSNNNEGEEDESDVDTAGSHDDSEATQQQRAERDEDLRIALELFSNDLLTVHRAIPEAKLHDQITNLLSDSVKTFVKFNMQQVQDRLCEQMEQLAAYKLSQKHAAGKPTFLMDKCTRPASDFYADFDRVSKKFQPIISTTNSLLVAHASMFMNMINTYAYSIFEFILTKLQNSHAVSDSKVLVSENSVATTPLGALMLARFSLYMAEKTVPEMDSLLKQRFADKHNQQHSLFDSKYLEKKLNQNASKLLLYYTEAQGQRLSSIMRKGIETPNWLIKKKPRDISLMIDLVVEEVNNINASVNVLFPNETTSLGPGSSHGSDHSARSSAYARSADSSSLLSGDKRANKSAPSLKSGNTNSSGSDPKATNYKDLANKAGAGGDNKYFNLNLAIAKDMERLFSKKLNTFTVKAPQFTRGSIVTGVIQIGLKTMLECVRLKTFAMNGFNQIQVDTYYLRMMWRELVDDESYLQLVMDEIVHSAADRCMDPKKPLDQNIIEAICNQKIGGGNNNNNNKDADDAATANDITSDSASLY